MAVYNSQHTRRPCNCESHAEFVTFQCALCRHCRNIYYAQATIPQRSLTRQITPTEPIIE